MTGSGPRGAGGKLALADLRGRALLGGAALLVRGIAVRAIALLGALGLVHFLSPAELGAAALGLAIVSLAGTVTNPGIGAALIRRVDDPTPEQLGGAVTAQFLVALSLALIATASAVAIGGSVAALTATLAWTLPVHALRVGAVVVLERALDFSRLARIEVAESAVLYTTAVGLAAGGAGAWALVYATLLKVVVGAVLLARAVPGGMSWPQRSLQHVKPILHEGSRIQLLGIVSACREQTAQLIIAGIGGLAALGIWALAQRLLQVPTLFLESLWRVTYPSVARLIALGGDLAGALRRGVAVIGLSCVVTMATLATLCTGLLPALFGDEWEPATEIVAGAGLGVVISGPLAAIGGGVLMASARTGALIRSVIVSGFLGVTLLILLLPSMGTAAIVVAFVCGSTVECVMLLAALRSSSAGGAGRRILAHAGIYTLSVGSSLLVAEAFDSPLLPPVATALMLMASTSLLAMDDAKSLWRLAREALMRTRAGRGEKGGGAPHSSGAQPFVA